MQTQNIECQIAQAQLRRYLTGEDLPYALVADLEAHLKNCPSCMEVARQKRDSLKGILVSEITGKPHVQPTPKAAPTMKAREIKQAIEQGKAVIQNPADVFAMPDEAFKIEKRKKAKSGNSKTIIYSVCLATILVLMSTVFKDPTKLFGPRAATIKKDTPTVEAAAPAAVETEPTIEAPNSEQPVVEQSTLEPATEAAHETTTGAPPVTNENKLETDGFLVADSVEGTKVVKDDPKPEPKPVATQQTKPKKEAGSTNTIKVYPPDTK